MFVGSLTLLNLEKEKTAQFSTVLFQVKDISPENEIHSCEKEKSKSYVLD
jgi:hypothetical protein